MPAVVQILAIFSNYVCPASHTTICFTRLAATVLSCRFIATVSLQVPAILYEILTWQWCFCRFIATVSLQVPAILYEILTWQWCFCLGKEDHSLKLMRYTTRFSRSTSQELLQAPNPKLCPMAALNTLHAKHMHKAGDNTALSTLHAKHMHKVGNNIALNTSICTKQVTTLPSTQAYAQSR